VTRAGRGGRHRRAAAILAGLCLLAALGFGPGARHTDAAWVGEEHVIASLNAAEIDAPVITSCVVRTALNLGLIFTGFTITWESPYALAQQHLTINGVTVSQNQISASGNGPYTYRAEFSANLLQSLLGSLLASNNAVEVSAVAGGWESAPAARVLSIGGLLGLTGPNRCTPA